MFSSSQNQKLCNVFSISRLKQRSRQDCPSRDSDMTEVESTPPMSFKALCSESGIIQELTEAYSPQQNGVAERANRTLVEMARSMLYHHHLPRPFLAEAIRTAAYIQEQLSNHQTEHCDSRRSMDRAQAKCKSSSDFRLCWLLSCCRCEQEKVGGQIQAMCVHRI